MRNDKIDSINLRSAYWMKEDLIAFCRQSGLSTSGSKSELLDRIEVFIKSGKKEKSKNAKKKPKPSNDMELSLDSIILEDYSNDENHRAFFIRQIGERFKFNVLFMNWMKANKGKKRYREAVDEWLRIEQEKKSGRKLEIQPQFEYNQYTRDFFKDNPNQSRENCIKCWNYKKGIDGNHKYEKKDLMIL
jgi:Domain of unknown function (DUF6434)/SAP domain-containing new25